MNYAEFQQTIAQTLHRQDMTAQIKLAITKGEAEINRELRVQDMICRARAPLQGRYIKVPDDFLELVNIQLMDEPPLILEQATLGQLDRMRHGSPNGCVNNGKPKFFAHSGREFELYPQPTVTTDLEITYYKRIPSLSDAKPSNWMLEQNADVYEAITMVHCVKFLEDTDAVGLWSQVYRELINSMKAEDIRRKHSGGIFRMRLA